MKKLITPPRTPDTNITRAISMSGCIVRPDGVLLYGRSYGQRHAPSPHAATRSPSNALRVGTLDPRLGRGQVSSDPVSRPFDLLVNERGADPKRIALVGISRGAILASIAGAVGKRFAGVALIYGGHFDALETGHLPAAWPANYIGRIAPRPLFMINGTQDSDMIQDRSVEPLFKVAKQPKQIIWTDGGHMFMSEEQRAAMIQWLRHTTH